MNSTVDIKVEVKELYPYGTGPSLEMLGRTVEEADDGSDMARKWERVATTMQVLVDEQGREAFMAELVERLVTPQSGCRECLREKMVEEAKWMVLEAKKKGLESLHIMVDVDITYSQVHLNNLP